MLKRCRSISHHLSSVILRMYLHFFFNAQWTDWKHYFVFWSLKHVLLNQFIFSFWHGVCLIMEHKSLSAKGLLFLCFVLHFMLFKLFIFTVCYVDSFSAKTAFLLLFAFLLGFVPLTSFAVSSILVPRNPIISGEIYTLAFPFILMPLALQAHGNLEANNLKSAIFAHEPC